MLVALSDWCAGRVLCTWRGHERGVNRVLAAPHVNGAHSSLTIKLPLIRADLAV